MKKIAIIIIIAILYAILAKLSQFLVPENTIVIPIWPPAGIALAAVLIFGNMALIAVFIGGFMSNLHMFSEQGLTLLSIAYTTIPGIGGALQAYVGKLAMVTFTGASTIFENTRSVLIFILIAAFATCTINATLGTTTLLLTGTIPKSAFLYNWLTWWISDSVGVIAVTSTIVAWYQKRFEKISASQLLKLSIAWLLIFILGFIILAAPVRLAFLFIPFAIWSAFQLEIRFSLLTALLISSLVIYGITHGYGIIPTKFGEVAIILIQIYISIVYLTILLIDAILRDRENAYKNLQLLNAQLEQRVLDRTKDLSESNKQLEIQKNKAIQAFEALKQSHARLMQSEKMASLGLLTAGVAHEIKHPLHAMSSNMGTIKVNIEHIVDSVEHSQSEETIKKDVNDTGENTETLIVATNEGINRTAGIIGDLCAYARDDEAIMVETNINQSIDSTLNLLSSEIKNIQIIKEYGKVPSVLCHPGKINQVIMNILINAIHALQTRSTSKIIIKTQSDHDFVIISIKDNGPGIKKEVLEKLFTPFFTTKREGLGSGLGLFLSQNIIKEHNGKISVTSELEKGTEFIIMLPIKGV